MENMTFNFKHNPDKVIGDYSTFTAFTALSQYQMRIMRKDP